LLCVDPGLKIEWKTVVEDPLSPVIGNLNSDIFQPFLASILVMGTSLT
jgi:hypothetical protein